MGVQAAPNPGELLPHRESPNAIPIRAATARVRVGVQVICVCHASKRVIVFSSNVSETLHVLGRGVVSEVAGSFGMVSPFAFELVRLVTFSLYVSVHV
ncbi:hypothetical protein NITLEN_20367 [Nitrospira lenta]|uniref:Uncharacterized protein n=1 Tax=Nitrospira lenta TaxID=1436998 RepID=A0A330L4W4_9BACT|nr:hypothetical protein NITLEN_20367 [Nitrospira lenta]